MFLLFLLATQPGHVDSEPTHLRTQAQNPSHRRLCTASAAHADCNSFSGLSDQCKAAGYVCEDSPIVTHLKTQGVEIGAIVGGLVLIGVGLKAQKDCAVNAKIASLGYTVGDLVANDSGGLYLAKGLVPTMYCYDYYTNVFRCAFNWTVGNCCCDDCCTYPETKGEWTVETLGPFSVAEAEAARKKFSRAYPDGLGKVGCCCCPEKNLDSGIDIGGVRDEMIPARSLHAVEMSGAATIAESSRAKVTATNPGASGGAGAPQGIEMARMPALKKRLSATGKKKKMVKQASPPVPSSEKLEFNTYVRATSTLELEGPTSKDIPKTALALVREGPDRDGDYGVFFFDFPAEGTMWLARDMFEVEAAAAGPAHRFHSQTPTAGDKVAVSAGRHEGKTGTIVGELDTCQQWSVKLDDTGRTIKSQAKKLVVLKVAEPTFSMSGSVTKLVRQISGSKRRTSLADQDAETVPTAPEHAPEPSPPPPKGTLTKHPSADAASVV